MVGAQLDGAPIRGFGGRAVGSLKRLTTREPVDRGLRRVGSGRRNERHASRHFGNFEVHEQLTGGRLPLTGAVPHRDVGTHRSDAQPG